MNYKIRRASLNDLDAITQLRIDLLMAVGDVKEDNRAEVFKANRDYFNKNLSTGLFAAWVAEVNNSIKGMSGFVYFQRPPHGENISGLEAYIMNMYTQPAYRGMGMARKLLEKSISDCKSSGVGRIWLHSSKDGYSLYKKMGFVEKDDEMELILESGFEQ